MLCARGTDGVQTASLDSRAGEAVAGGDFARGPRCRQRREGDVRVEIDIWQDEDLRCWRRADWSDMCSRK
jgi:hypothetical protein